MSVELLIAVELFIALGTSIAVRAIADRAPANAERDSRFAEAVAAQTNPVGRILVGAARPVATLSPVAQAATSPTYQALENRVVASGLFARSLEVFLAVQALALFVSAMALTFMLTLGSSGMDLVIFGGAAVLIGAFPYLTVKSAADKRAAAVARGLPEFAELLQMPLSSGVGVRSSLRFTAERLDGPVSAVALAMLDNLASRTLTDEECYALAGQVLGTPAAQDFFTALKQADLEGAKIADTLSKQADALRAASYQAARAEMKKLPIKVLLVFFLHLLPFLLVVAMLPTVASLGGIGS